MFEKEFYDDIQVKIFLKKVSIPSPENKDTNFIVDGEDVYLWWDDIGKVKISRGNQIAVEPETDLNNYDGVSIIPFLLGPVMSLLLHQRGFLVLHGSSVKVNGEAIAFLGYRGMGKSTTAINLYKNGYPLVTDDILAIKFQDNEPVVYPGYPHVRLSEDSFINVRDDTDILTPIKTYAGKIFCDASQGFYPEPVKLKKIYIIEDGEKTRISKFQSQESVINLIRHSTANRIMDGPDQVENLMQCSKLINNSKISRLEINHSFNNIPDLVNLIDSEINNMVNIR